MPFLPTPLQNNVVIQNSTTGVVDFLKYEGSTLVASSAHDYGLGANFKIVADVWWRKTTRRVLSTFSILERMEISFPQ